MFLIAGVQPRTHKGPKMDQNCPHCGLAQVYERRVDHYLSLFFIPLLRVTKGESGPWCERCQQPLSTLMGANGSETVSKLDGRVCRDCGAVLDPEFSFCPHCGKEIQ
jgi:predicted RNA-binding Zn-ribbon protein involved in translation (DUF1610 family)